MDLKEKIESIKIIDEDKVLKIEEHDAYIYKTSKNYMVVIPFEYDDNKMIDEDFVGAEFFTDTFKYDNDVFKALYLSTPNDIDVYKFASLAVEFADLKNRKKINSNPLEWIDDWKKLFGNAIKNKMVYDVLGELVALKEVYKIDKTAVWQGPKAGTFDIECKDRDVEVKSTKNKTQNIISINSSHQTNGRDEKLYFARFEKNDYGMSINSIVDELVSIGYPEDELEENLKILGYVKGKSERDLTFRLLNLYVYDVNKTNFPHITIEKINEDNMFNSIIGYELKVDLTPIPHDTIV